jgi:hypothetical protein
LPCTTGLAFYLSRCVRFTNGRHCFQHPPPFGVYRRTNQRRLGRGQTLTDALTPRLLAPLSRLRLRNRDLATVSVSPCTVRNKHPHWLTVATTDLFDRLCSPFPAKTRPVRHHSTRGRSSARQVLTPSRHRLPTVLCSGTARRRTPFRSNGRSRSRPREPVKYASKPHPCGPLQGAGNASSSRPFSRVTPGAITEANP